LGQCSRPLRPLRPWVRPAHPIRAPIVQQHLCPAAGFRPIPSSRIVAGAGRYRPMGLSPQGSNLQAGEGPLPRSEQTITSLGRGKPARFVWVEGLGRGPPVRDLCGVRPAVSSPALSCSQARKHPSAQAPGRGLPVAGKRPLARPSGVLIGRSPGESYEPPAPPVGLWPPLGETRDPPSAANPSGGGKQSCTRPSQAKSGRRGRG